MATRSHPVDHPLDARSLLDVLSGLLDDDHPDQLVVGIEPQGEHVDLHVAPLPPDDRAGSAGLFGMRAGDGWCAVATAVAGRARHLDDVHVVGRARALIVVDRQGGVASRLLVDDEPVGVAEDADGRVDPGPPTGLAVDAMHRMLGLPSPGAPPHAALVALAVWSQLLVLHTLEHGGTTWSQAVGLHPGHPGGRHVDASVETVVEATLRTDGQLDWGRMHRRACAGHGPVDLTRDEVAWMDPTLYGRWVLGGLPDAELAAQVLVAHDQERTARSVLQVAEQVVARLGPMNPV